MNLKEVQYDKIFSPETIASLKGKSGESLRQMWGNKTLRQALVTNMQLLEQLVEFEYEYRDELEMIAVQIVKDNFPIIDYTGIEIDAKIVDQGEINLDMDGGEKIEGGDEMPENFKRRIINGITQGASVRGAYTFLLFREYLDAIDPSLLEKYRELLNVTFGVFDDDNAIAMMLAMLANGMKQEGGSSDADFDAETGVLTITARALCFPYLVHEIVKGLYEIVSLQGFGADKEKNKQIVQHVDRLDNEPEDTRYGKFIYDAINNLFVNSNYDDPRIRELLFTEIYKLDDHEFLIFIENMLNNRLTSQQKHWVEQSMRDIESDLKADDAGVEIDDDF